MPTGSGSSLGEAFANAIAAVADGMRGTRARDLKGWHAQIAELTRTPRGYLAAEKAGLSASADTLRKWLTQDGGRDDFAPSKANREKIAEAYRIYRGRWPAELEGRDVKVTGLVKVGGDERMRGRDGHSALLVTGGDWEPIKEAWTSGRDLSDQRWEDLFIDHLIIDGDLGETTDSWEFPGDSYEVEIVM